MKNQLQKIRRPKHFKLKPQFVLAGYLLLVVIFALLYYILDVVSAENIYDSLYFSVVTVTTLGYGDIVPKSGLGKVLVSIQTLVGVISIGVFLNSLWQMYADKIGVQEKEILEEIQRDKEIRKFLLYSKYLQYVLKDYKNICYEMTTPLEERRKEAEFDPDFSFSDMVGMFDMTLNRKYEFDRKVVDIYSEIKVKVVRELKYILANFDISSNETLYNTIIDFIYLVDGVEIISPLVYMSKKSREDFDLRKTIKYLKERSDLEDKERYRGHPVYLVVVLYHSLKAQHGYLRAIELELKRLTQVTASTTRD